MVEETDYRQEGSQRPLAQHTLGQQSILKDKWGWGMGVEGSEGVGGFLGRLGIFWEIYKLII